MPLELHDAIKRGDIELVKNLTKENFDVNAVNNDGRTPLFLACYLKKSTEIAKFLIDNGADVNAYDINKQTPLFWACSQDNFELTKLLIKHGANVLATDKDGSMPITHCINKEMLQFLSRNILLRDPETKNPFSVYRKQERSSIWNQELERINFYLKNEKTGTNKITKQAYLREIANKGPGTLRYLSFFAIPINNNISSIPQSFTPG